MANYLTDRNYPVTILTGRAISEFKKGLKEARIIETGLDTNKLIFTLHNIMPYFDIINPHNHPAEIMIYPRKTKVVWQLNEPPLEVLQGKTIDSLQKQVINDYIEKIVVITDYEKKRSGEMLGRNDIILNYPGVRFDYFSKKVDPTETRKKYKLEDKFVILEAGYITFTKNQVKAVEILAKVKKQIPNAVLVLAGYDKDPYKQQVQSKALDLGVLDDVIFTGFIEKDEEIRDLYNIADVYIGPFLDQGGWATTFEAVCAGCPIIVSPSFVAANLVSENNLGVVTDTDNFEGHIYNIKDKEELSKFDTKETAKWIGENLTWDNFGERYVKIFEEIWHEDNYTE